jgi:hypothetical protein
MNFDASLCGSMLRRTLDLMRATPLVCIGAICAAAVCGVIYDYSTLTRPDSFGGVNLIYWFALLLVQILVTHAALVSAPWQLVAGRSFPIGLIFGANLVSGLAILLGFVLLVLPGIFISARYYLVAPILMTEDTTIMGSLRKSWDVTERHWLSIAILFVGMFILIMSPVALTWDMTTLSFADEGWTWPRLGLGNLLAGIGTVTSYYLAVAAFDLIVRPPAEVQREIFS